MIANDIEYIRSQPASLQCTHDETRICRRRQSNGVIVLARQCTRCGHSRGNVAKKSPEVLRLAEIPDWDQSLYDAWQQERTEYYDERRRQLQATQPGSAEWWKQYNEYLNSAEWQSKRQIVLKRDNYLCQGCFQARASDIHHLTYRHMGNELLFELVSVCRKCHQRIHSEMEQDQS